MIRLRSVWLAAALTASAAAILPAPVRADEVKIGMISTFSGPYSRWGRQMDQAIAVFQKHNGETVNGHKITIVRRDDGGPDPAKSKQLAEELILREKVQMIMGFPWSPNALSVAPVVTEAKIPTFIYNAATGVITRNSPYFIRTSFTLPQVAAPEGTWAARNGIKSVVNAIIEFAPGIDAENFFSQNFKAGGGEVLESIRIPFNTTDFSPFFERALAKKPDALFMFGPGGPGSVGMVTTWASRLKPAGIKLLATNEIVELDMPAFGPSALGVVSAGHYTETNTSPLNVKLRADLEAMFGKEAIPDIASVATYDGMRLIYDIVAKLGPKFDPDEAIKITAGRTIDSPRGSLTIDAKERDAVQDIDIRRVEERNGRLVNVAFDSIKSVKDPWKEQNPAK